MLLVKDFKDYEIISMSKKEKLERWGKYYLLRPDSEIIWESDMDYSKIDAHYHRSNTGGGYWEEINKLPESWKINYKDLTFNVKLMGFKHTGIFPEQSINWDYMMDKISKEKEKGRDVKVLNLFAYTGCASCAILNAGGSVTHVDSSKGMTLWAKENVKSCNLEDKPIRYIVEDVIKFVEREIRRGNKYDAIIMDPPSYGRGSNKEVWTLENNLFNLITLCEKLLTPDPLFFIINSYASSISKTSIENALKIVLKDYKGKIYSEELGIKSKNNTVLPCGVCIRYER